MRGKQLLPCRVVPYRCPCSLRCGHSTDGRTLSATAAHVRGGGSVNQSFRTSVIVRQPTASAQGVLAAIGVPAAFGGGSLRLSVGRHSTAEEVRRGAALIVAGIREQRRRVQCGSGAVVL